MADPTKDGKGPVTDPNLTDEEKLAAIEAQKAKDDAAAAGDAGDKSGADDRQKVDDEDASVERLQSFMKKKGINDISKLVDLAENLEKRNTLLDQDVRRLQAAGRISLGEGVTQPPPAAGRQVVTIDDDIDIDVPENPMELITDRNTLKDFSKKLVKAGRDMARRETQQERFEAARARVQAKMAENPDEFERLRPIMLNLSRSYPNADIDQLYGAAKEIHERDRKALVEEVKANLGVTGDDAARLRSVVGRLRQAPITSGTGNQVTVTKDSKKDDAAFLKAIMDSDKF